MTRFIKTLAAATVGIVLATGAFAQTATKTEPIEHHIAKIDGTRFHYVTAGTGDPVLLLPGWPESWLAWRKVLPLLVSAGRRVVILDPRGFGESDKPADGYDRTRPHATCIGSWKRPTRRPRAASTSLPMTSGRGSRTPTP
jgi:alpha/beta hydrolase fold